MNYVCLRNKKKASVSRTWWDGEYLYSHHLYGIVSIVSNSSICSIIISPWGEEWDDVGVDYGQSYRAFQKSQNKEYEFYSKNWEDIKGQ